VEIGGSFRVPEIMAASGTKLVEVGTTNRTHPDDYRNAITPNTAAIVKVHRSNFTMDGFVSEVDIPTLVPIAEEVGISLIHDFGSGLMLDLSEYGLTGELTAREAVQQNPTLVIMSGDKLLGGPQAGIILGKKDVVAKLKKHPMARALRVDKLTYSALEATLGLYRNPNKALLQIPALLMLTTDQNTIRFRAETIAQQVGGVVEKSEATVGGGAFPTSKISSWSVVLSGNAMELEQRLRGGRIPVITRIIEDKVWLDIRSVLPTDDELLITLIREMYL
jgi:L-seryl-tRNA(Ser) seleniumtransferase